MAVWQFEFIIVPREKLMQQKNTILEGNKILDREKVMAWEGYSISEESIKEISRVLSVTKGWSDSVIQFGSLDESCLELNYEKGILSEISCRLDLRSITLEILDTVIKFIKENKAVIVTNNNIYVEAVIEYIVIEIKKSAAYRFCQNPKDFFLE